MTKYEKTSYNIAEAVKIVTRSDDEECNDGFENDVKEQIGGDNDLHSQKEK